MSGIPIGEDVDSEFVPHGLRHRIEPSKMRAANLHESAL